MTLLSKLAIKTNTYNNWINSPPTIWKGSTFEQWSKYASGAKGKQGELLCADLMQDLGSTVLRNKKGKPIRPKGAGKGFDLVIDNFKTEVKASSTWGNSLDNWKWQQIRGLQQYDRIIFMGINPDDMYMWWATKQDLQAHVFGRNAYRQHGGKDGKQDVYWIRAQGLQSIPSWFRKMGTW